MSNYRTVKFSDIMVGSIIDSHVSVGGVTVREQAIKMEPFGAPIHGYNAREINTGQPIPFFIDSTLYLEVSSGIYFDEQPNPVGWDEIEADTLTIETLLMHGWSTFLTIDDEETLEVAKRYCRLDPTHYRITKGGIPI